MRRPRARPWIRSGSARLQACVARALHRPGRSAGRLLALELLAEADEPKDLRVPEGLVSPLAHLIPQLRVRAHLGASPGQSPTLGRLHQPPADASSPVGRPDEPPLDVADRLCAAAFRPVANGDLDEADNITAGRLRDEDPIAVRVLADQLLLPFEVVPGAIGLERLTQDQPGVGIFGSQVTDLHWAPLSSTYSLR